MESFRWSVEPLDPVTEPAAPPFSRLQEMLLTAESSSSGRIVVGQASVGQSVLCTDFELHVKVSDYNAAVHQVRVIAGSDPSTGEQSATGDAAAASTPAAHADDGEGGASEADSSASKRQGGSDSMDRAAWARSVLESDPSLVHLVACGEATNFRNYGRANQDSSVRLGTDERSLQKYFYAMADEAGRIYDVDLPVSGEYYVWVRLYRPSTGASFRSHGSWNHDSGHIRTTPRSGGGGTPSTATAALFSPRTPMTPPTTVGESAAVTTPTAAAAAAAAAAAPMTPRPIAEEAEVLEGAGEVWDVAQQKTSCARLPQKSWGSLVANDASDLGWVRSGRACRLSAGRHTWQWGSLKDGNAYSFGASEFIFTTNPSLRPGDILNDGPMGSGLAARLRSNYGMAKTWSVVPPPEGSSSSSSSSSLSSSSTANEEQSPAAVVAPVKSASPPQAHGPTASTSVAAVRAATAQQQHLPQ